METFEEIFEPETVEYEFRQRQLIMQRDSAKLNKATLHLQTNRTKMISMIKLVEDHITAHALKDYIVKYKLYLQYNEYGIDPYHQVTFICDVPYSFLAIDFDIKKLRSDYEFKHSHVEMVGKALEGDLNVTVEYKQPEKLFQSITIVLKAPIPAEDLYTLQGLGKIEKQVSSYTNEYYSSTC